MAFAQYFGSSLQLTPHLHVLVPEGPWRRTVTGGGALGAGGGEEGRGNRQVRRTGRAPRAAERSVRWKEVAGRSETGSRSPGLVKTGQG